MLKIADYLFGAASFMPHGYCLLWRPDLVVLHGASDAFIALAYFSIPAAILVFITKRKDFHYRYVAWLFIGFITLCGLTHLVGLITLWFPVYGFQGLVKAATAIISVTTAVLLWPFLPKLLALPSPDELKHKNQALSEEIAKRHILKDELRQSEERFREAFASAPLGMAIVGVDGRFIDVNNAICLLLGVERSELIGREMIEFLDLGSVETNRASLVEILDQSTERSNFETSFRHQSGRSVPVLESVSFVQVNGSLNGYFVVQLLDLTAQKEAEDLLRQTNEELERRVQERTASLKQANQDLSDFSHVLSHDLKSPIRGIRILIDELRESITEDDKERVEKTILLLDDRAKRAAKMVSDLLDYSRSGNTATKAEAIVTSSIVANALHTVSAPSTFDIEVGDLPDLEGYRVPLETVFRNLLTNAINHHDQDHGRIVISGQIQGKHVVFEVEDDGPGIPKEKRAMAFAMFRRLHPSQGVGSGMGLTMVKRLVEMQGGAIELDYPKQGRGTVVRFSWPRQLSKGPEQPGWGQHDRQPMHSGNRPLTTHWPQSPLKPALGG